MKVKAIAFFIAACLITAACDSIVENYGIEKNGDFVEIGSGTISTGNHGINVTSEQSDFNGLEIYVNEGYSGPDVEFEIYAGDLPGSFQNNSFIPVDEILRIKNGGEFSNNTFFIQIPVTSSENEMPVAFAYNETTESLEPLAVVDYDNSSITIAARSFIQTTFSSDLKTSYTTEIMDYASIIVGTIAVSTIENNSTIMSDFIPGKDDWEFDNNGSIMEPGGNCAGMVLSSLFYYDFKEWANQVELSSLYDREEQLWEDNTLGIRLVSEVQKETGSIAVAGIWNDFFNRKPYAAPGDFYDEYHKIAYNNAIAQLLVTKRPIYTEVWPKNTLTDGHAVLIIGINRQDSVLYIADPNFEGATRTAEIKPDGYFDYISGINAREADNILYERFICLGFQQMANWKLLADLWRQLDQGTIGDQRFPGCDYQVTFNPGQEDESTTSLPEMDKNWLDPLSVSRENITVRIKCEVTDKSNNSVASNIWIWEDSKWILKSARDRNFIDLDLEVFDLYNSTIGIYISRPATVDNTPTNEWVDFKWLNISDISISPKELAGKTQTEYSWEVSLSDPPANTRFEWNFGDGSETMIIRNKTTASHTYTQEGVFPILLRAFDDDTDKPFGVAAGIANISNIPLGQKLVRVALGRPSLFQTTGWGEYDFLNEEVGISCGNDIYGDSHDDIGNLSWSGTSFSANYVEIIGISTITTEIEGRISDDRKELVEIYCRQELRKDWPAGGIDRYINELEFKDVPITYLGTPKSIIEDEIKGVLTNMDLNAHVTKAYWSHLWAPGGEIPDVLVEVIPIDLSDPTITLQVRLFNYR